MRSSSLIRRVEGLFEADLVEGFVSADREVHMRRARPRRYDRAPSSLCLQIGYLRLRAEVAGAGHVRPSRLAEGHEVQDKDGEDGEQVPDYAHGVRHQPPDKHTIEVGHEEGRAKGQLVGNPEGVGENEGEEEPAEATQLELHLLLEVLPKVADQEQVDDDKEE